MDTLWLIVGLLFMLAGLVGCFIPLLPGPPLSYIALLLLQLRTDAPFTTKFLLIWGGITIVVTALDFIIPLYGTKRYGGSKYGMWGCAIGLVAGLFVPPLGIIIGPFLGAFIGELLYANNSTHALKAALGSFFGFLLGTFIKVVACGVMLYYFIAAL